MVDAILHVVSTAYPGQFAWDRVIPCLATLFDEPTPPPLNRAVTLISPYVPWDDKWHDQRTVIRWAAAVLAVPYMEEIGFSVFNPLLQIASIDSLRPHIPIDLWARLKKLPSLPPVCLGRVAGGKEVVVRRVRKLGDIEILKSFFLLVWSEWNFLSASGFEEMKISIREDFGGVELRHHREDLIQRLDGILGQLDRGYRYIAQYKPGVTLYHLQRTKVHYRTLKEVLLEVESEFSGLVVH